MLPVPFLRLRANFISVLVDNYRLCAVTADLIKKSIVFSEKFLVVTKAYARAMVCFNYGSTAGANVVFPLFQKFKNTIVLRLRNTIGVVSLKVIEVLLNLVVIGLRNTIGVICFNYSSAARANVVVPLIIEVIILLLQLIILRLAYAIRVIRAYNSGRAARTSMGISFCQECIILLNKCVVLFKKLFIAFQSYAVNKKLLFLRQNRSII